MNDETIDYIKPTADEWRAAKTSLHDAEGNLLANGTKYRRADSGLKHSFLIIDDQILAVANQGNYIGSGAYGKVKLAENEDGKIYALKVSATTLFADESASSEFSITEDVGIAGKPIKRASTTKKSINNVPLTQKSYLACDYLGKSVEDQLNVLQNAPIDKQYDLLIKTAMQIYELHTGRASKTGTPFVHCDLHLGNVVFQENNPDDLTVRLIDYGSSRVYQNETQNSDLQRFILEFVYCPPKLRKKNQFAGFLAPTGPDPLIEELADKRSDKSIEDILVALTVCRFGLNDQFGTINTMAPKQKMELVKTLNQVSTSYFRVKQAIETNPDLPKKALADFNMQLIHYISPHNPIPSQLKDKNLKEKIDKAQKSIQNDEDVFQQLKKDATPITINDPHHSQLYNTLSQQLQRLSSTIESKYQKLCSENFDEMNAILECAKEICTLCSTEFENITTFTEEDIATIEWLLEQVSNTISGVNYGKLENLKGALENLKPNPEPFLTRLGQLIMNFIQSCQNYLSEKYTTLKENIASVRTSYSESHSSEFSEDDETPDKPGPQNT